MVFATCSHSLLLSLPKTILGALARRCCRPAGLPSTWHVGGDTGRTVCPPGWALPASLLACHVRLWCWKQSTAGFARLAVALAAHTFFIKTKPLHSSIHSLTHPRIPLSLLTDCPNTRHVTCVPVGGGHGLGLVRCHCRPRQPPRDQGGMQCRACARP